MKFKLVKKEDEAIGTKSFFFVPSEEFTWQAGQYAYLTFGEITKQFTISSSPTEKIIRITTRIRQNSEFKQKLNKLEVGEEVEARAPFGTFIFENNNFDNVYLAGGIGITPFRSFIKYNMDQKLGSKIYLIYSNSDNDFVFRNELDKWQKENDFIKIHYYNSSVSGHLDAKNLLPLFDDLNIKNTIFWSVGPTPFVNAIEDILEEVMIPQDQIRTEKFIGY